MGETRLAMRSPQERLPTATPPVRPSRVLAALARSLKRELPDDQEIADEVRSAFALAWLAAFTRQCLVLVGVQVDGLTMPFEAVLQELVALDQRGRGVSDDEIAARRARYAAFDDAWASLAPLRAGMESAAVVHYATDAAKMREVATRAFALAQKLDLTLPVDFEREAAEEGEKLIGRMVLGFTPEPEEVTPVPDDADVAPEPAMETEGEAAPVPDDVQ